MATCELREGIVPVHVERKGVVLLCMRINLIILGLLARGFLEKRRAYVVLEGQVSTAVLVLCDAG